MDVLVLATEEESLRKVPGCGRGGGISEPRRPLALSPLIELVGEADPSVGPFAEAAAAAAACRSLREAFPRFFRSRAYSHFSAKSRHENSILATLCRPTAIYTRQPPPQCGIFFFFLLLTDTMLTRQPSIALCSQLVALIAGPTDTSPNRAMGGAVHLFASVNLLIVVWEDSVRVMTSL